MSRFAALLMFIAWLLYGAMPATAMPMGDSPMAGMVMGAGGAGTDTNAPATHDMAEMAGGAAAHAMTSHPMPANGTSSNTMAGMAHDHGSPIGGPAGKMPAANKAMAFKDVSHCPHGGKICVAPFCAACLTLLPDLTFIDGRSVAYRYPAPGIAADLTSAGPSPATPPPRV